MAQIWAGVDIGKTGHHCVVINTDGKRLLSRRIANDEPELVKLIDEVRELGQDTVWAVDLPDGGAALLIGLLVERDQQLLYIPGRTLNPVLRSVGSSGRPDRWCTRLGGIGGYLDSEPVQGIV